MSNYLVKFFNSIFIIIILLISNYHNSSFAQNKNVVIPFNIYDDWIFIKANINQTLDLDLMFDTGFNIPLLNSKKIDKLNLRPDSKTVFSAAIGEDSLFCFANNNFKIGSIVLNNLKFLKAPLEDMELKFGDNIDGMIGYDFLKDHIVKIDFENNHLEVFDDINNLQNKPKNFFNIILRDSIPVIKAVIKINETDSLSGEFIIDTGCNSSLILSTLFVNKNNLLDKIKKNYSFNPITVFQSEKKTLKARINGVNFCGFNFHNIPITLSQDKSGILLGTEYDGIIGNEIIKRFNITFDYQHLKIYLEENKAYKENYRVNCSGLEIKLNKNRNNIIINDVYDNSPAAVAKLRKGDIILKIQGKDAKYLSLREVKDILRESGKTIEIVVKNKNEIKTVQLILKELI